MKTGKAAVRLGIQYVMARVSRLLLNPAKTEVLWCASSRRQHLIPTESVL